MEGIWDLVSSGAMYNTKFIGDILLKKNSTGELHKFNTPEFLKYTKMLMIEEGIGGLFVQRTVKEYLEGYQDPLLKSTSMSQVEEGGDPTINYITTITNSDGGSYNSTGAFFVGDDVHDLTREQAIYLNNRYIRTYGLNCTGIRSWEPTYYDPWKEKVPLKGTDAGQFRPLNYKHNDLYLFSSDVMRTVDFKFKKKKTIHGLTAWTYEPNNNLLLTSEEAEENDLYYSGFHGSLNVTSVYGAPAFATKGHYLDIGYNENRTSIIRDKAGNLIKADKGKDDLYITIEPWSGATMQAGLRLMLNFRINHDFLFENVEDQYLLPYTYIRKEFALSGSQVSDGLGALRMALNASLGVQISGYIVGILLILGGGFLIFWAWKIKKAEGLTGYTSVEEVQPSEENEKKAPMLNKSDHISIEETKEDISQDVN